MKGHERHQVLKKNMTLGRGTHFCLLDKKSLDQDLLDSERKNLIFNWFNIIKHQTIKDLAGFGLKTATDYLFIFILDTK